MINISGLAIGMAASLLILQYASFELSYDNYHENAGSIYRTTSVYYQNNEPTGKNPLSGYAQGPALVADVPEIKTAVRTHPMYGGAVVTVKKEAGEPLTFHEERLQFVDSTFLDVFTYVSIHGDLNTALDNPNSVVITKKNIRAILRER